jgi:DNA helicase-2/ATP-dependent DNA helicase PcrA
MNTLILTRAHYRRRYGNDAPEMSVPSRFLEEVPSQLIENLGGRSPAWSTPTYGAGYGAGRRRAPSHTGDFDGQHYNYEDESQEAYNPSATGKKASGSKPFVASWMKPKVTPTDAESAPKSTSAEAPPPPLAGKPDSIDNIARFFGGKTGIGKPGAMPRPALEIPASRGASGLRKGQRVRHAKYGEGTVLMREGDGEDAKLSVMFNRHGLKKLIEKFANLEKI